MKRNRLIGCGLVALLGVGLGIGLLVAVVGGLFALTKPVVDASELFLARLGRGEVAEAYASTSDTLRATQDEATFAAAVRRLSLTEFASASWHNRQIENRTALAEGTVTTRSGLTRPVTVRLVRDGGRWAVGGLRVGGIELTAAPPPVPPGAELERMVAETLSAFDRAVRG